MKALKKGIEITYLQSGGQARNYGPHVYEVKLRFTTTQWDGTGLHADKVSERDVLDTVRTHVVRFVDFPITTIESVFHYRVVKCSEVEPGVWVVRCEMAYCD